MSTKRTLCLIGIIGCCTVVLIILGRRTGNHVFSLIASVLSFMLLGLLFYASIRETKCGDKSPRMSIVFIVTVFSVIGIFLIYGLFGALLQIYR